MNTIKTIRTLKSGMKTVLIFALTVMSSLAVSLLGVGKESLIMVYLLGVLFTTVLTSSYLYGIVTSFASLMIFNFLFTEPRFTFVVYNRNDVVLLVFFLVTAIVSGIVTSRLQQQIELTARNERTTQVLYQIASGFLPVSGKQMVVEQGITYIREYAGCECSVALDDGEKYPDKHIHQPGMATLKYPIRSVGGQLGIMEIATQDTPIDERTELIIQTVVTQLGIALDREQLYNDQEQIRLAMESERLRATLLRSVAHDLRSPLTGLLGAGNLLADNYHHLKDQERIQLATDISEEIIWLSNLVENILDMTRINDSQLVIHKENEVVDDVVSEAVSHVDRLLRERHLTVRLPEDVVMVPMDGRLIVRVLINLLENAVHHTLPEAAITLSADVRGEVMEFTVADTGDGIDESVRQGLFDRFVTLDKVVSDGKRGIGLGLANCKALIEAHGGSIRAEDNTPKGAKFIFTLPMKE